MQLVNYLARHREYLESVATLVSGKALAAALALVTTPIIARLFVASDFGVFALFVALTLVISGIASLRYEAAIVVPEDEQEALSLMALAYRVMLSVSAILFALIAVCRVAGIRLPAIELLGNYQLLLPLAILLMAAIHIQESWLTRKKGFKLSSVSLVAGNLTSNGTRIGLGWSFGTSAGALIFGQLVGTMCRLIVQHNVGRLGLRSLKDTRWSSLKELARRYADFPKFNASAALIFALGHNLPVLLFGVMFSTTVAGYFAMANQLVRAPVALVTESVLRVFLQKVSEITNQRRSARKAFLLTSGGLAILGMPPLLLIWLFGQPLATWFLSERWVVAGQYLEVIAPGLFAMWVSAHCNAVFLVLREQRILLILNIAATALQLAGFGVAWLSAADPVWTLRIFVLMGIVGHVAKWTTALMRIDKHDRDRQRIYGD